jgi:hypothetical protein
LTFKDGAARLASSANVQNWSKLGDKTIFGNGEEDHGFGTTGIQPKKNRRAPKFSIS